MRPTGRFSGVTLSRDPARNPSITNPPAPFDAGAFLSRALFDQSPFSTVIYDAEGHLVAVNDAFRRFWGVGADTAPANYCVFEDKQLEEQGALAYIRRA